MFSFIYGLFVECFRESFPSPESLTLRLVARSFCRLVNSVLRVDHQTPKRWKLNSKARLVIDLNAKSFSFNGFSSLNNFSQLSLNKNSCHLQFSAV